MRRLSTFSLALALTLAVSSTAEAQENAAGASASSGTIIGQPGAGFGTGFTVSVVGSFGAYDQVVGAGVGGLFSFPLLRDGFIPSLNDSFHLEFGAFTTVGFYEFGQDAVWFSPVAGARWDFHIVEPFTAFVALRSGPALGLNRVGSTLYLDGVVGGFWRFSKPVALRFEIGGGVLGGGFNGGVAFWF